jgi:hypothetical protein
MPCGAAWPPAGGAIDSGGMLGGGTCGLGSVAGAGAPEPGGCWPGRILCPSGVAPEPGGSQVPSPNGSDCGGVVPGGVPAACPMKRASSACAIAGLVPPMPGR